jgi:hypothetical protein
MNSKKESCHNCEEDGHKWNVVLVNIGSSFRKLKYCICCGNYPENETDHLIEY